MSLTAFYTVPPPAQAVSLLCTGCVRRIRFQGSGGYWRGDGNRSDYNWNHDASSPVVNLKNLNVLTDYLQNGNLRNPQGEVRHVILSEQGFTSKSLTRGENNDLQAAAIAYAYYIADSNPYVDAFIMSRQVDAPLEVNSSLMFGLWRCDMSRPNEIIPTMRKKAWSIYKNIDNRKTTLETTEFAKEIIGIEKWSDVIPNFKWKSQE